MKYICIHKFCSNNKSIILILSIVNLILIRCVLRSGVAYKFKNKTFYFCIKEETCANVTVLSVRLRILV